MNNIYQILWTTFSSSAIIGFIVWLGRSWIKNKLEKSIEHSYSKKIETHKAQLQKQNEEYKQKFLLEIEAYKSSLIRDLEEYKLGIDLRRNLAIQYSNKKIELYEKIAAIYDPIMTDIVTYSKLEKKNKPDYNSFMVNKMSELSNVQLLQKKQALYIDSLKIGIPLANLYKDTIYFLGNEENLYDEKKINDLLMENGLVSTLMKNDILGDNSYEETIEKIHNNMGLFDKWDEIYKKYLEK